MDFRSIVSVSSIWVLFTGATQTPVMSLHLEWVRDIVIYSGRPGQGGGLSYCLPLRVTLYYILIIECLKNELLHQVMQTPVVPLEK